MAAAIDLTWVTLFLSATALAAVGASIWLFGRVRRLERQYRALTSGADGGSLEAVLHEHVRQVRAAVERVQELDAAMSQVEQASRSHLQRVGFLRFNPFRDTGGDQSFALALTDEAGNGVVISSLHSREVTRVYAKPLTAWETGYQLTEEERQAIQRARGEA
jgi:hypothetical protein